MNTKHALIILMTTFLFIPCAQAINEEIAEADSGGGSFMADSVLVKCYSNSESGYFEVEKTFYLNKCDGYNGYFLSRQSDCSRQTSMSINGEDDELIGSIYLYANFRLTELTSDLISLKRLFVRFRDYGAQEGEIRSDIRSLDEFDPEFSQIFIENFRTTRIRVNFSDHDTYLFHEIKCDFTPMIWD